VRLLIAGAGGHARVVVDAARRAVLQGAENHLQPALIVDDNPALHGTNLLGVEVISSVLFEGNGTFAFHVAIGNNATRERKFAALAGQLAPASIVHPHASVSESAFLGDGSFIAAQAVIGPLAMLGIGCIINHGAIVDHDCVVGNFCHIAPNATLAGNVRLGQRVLVGAGANVLPGVFIGDDCVVGAGAVVLRDIESGSIQAGVPARAI
jgi:sugar O-acyltransferase (sialic acid O-acetyltransferase NeuD family)